MRHFEKCYLCGGDFRDCSHTHYENELAFERKKAKKEKKSFFIIPGSPNLSVCTACFCAVPVTFQSLHLASQHPRN